MRPPKTLDRGSCVGIRGNSNSTPASSPEGSRSPIVSLGTPQGLGKIYELFCFSFDDSSFEVGNLKLIFDTSFARTKGRFCRSMRRKFISNFLDWATIRH